MTTRNPLARSADQRMSHNGPEITIHDKAHSPSWRREGSRGHGEVTFRVGHENGVPVLFVRIVEISDTRTIGERPEGRESKFEIFGSNALEVLEIVRLLEETPTTLKHNL